jgi:drug/metabolite transporter (DMT)-like permease
MNEIAGKFIEHIDPIAITCFRFLVGGILLLMFVIPNRHKYKGVISLKYLAIISGIGVLNVCLSMYVLQWGIYYGQASLAAIIVSANPIFVSFFAHFILKEKLSFKTLLCLLVGLGGLSLVIFGQFSDMANFKNISLAIIFSVSASVSFALYTVLSKQQIEKSDSYFFNAISFLAGAVILFIFGLGFQQNMSITTDGKTIFWLLFLGVFVTGIAYITYFKGLKKIDTAIGSSFFLLKPIFASILAYFLLGEKLTLIQIIGVLIVIMALMVQTYMQKSSVKTSN